MHITYCLSSLLLLLCFFDVSGDRWCPFVWLSPAFDQVRLFVVHDTASGARQGHFYLDLHPRHGKYGHAAIFHLLKRNSKNDGQTAVDCMLCNLPAPALEGPRKGKPALLLHSNVVTFFHEFGHIMHGLCAEGDGNATHLAKCEH